MECVMIRYGEIFLKSEPVMRRFLSTLVSNITKALSTRGLAHRIEEHRGRIIVFGDDPAGIAEAASSVFGVVGVSVCRMTGTGIGEVADEAAAMAAGRLTAGATYAVRARRSGVEGYTSQELAAAAGAAIGAAVPGSRVDLGTPDYEISVEAREFGALIYDNRTDGPGGLPYGTQGQVVTLLSEGIDSPVAAWMIMKRGCSMAFLYIDTGRFGGADKAGSVSAHHRRLSEWCMGHPLDLHIVDGEPFYEALTARATPQYRCVICKRYMLRVACGLADRLGAPAVVTGESLAQVASQTLGNLAVIDAGATVPVLRPLIGYDKTETTAIASRIGTLPAAGLDLGCRVAPKHPATAASMAAVEREEERMEIAGLVGDALDSARIVRALNGEIT